MTRKEYDELKKTIEYHMDLYYNQDTPQISDYEYDQMMIALKEAEKEHPDWVSADSPSQKVGGTVKRTAGVKVTHRVPMSHHHKQLQLFFTTILRVRRKSEHPIWMCFKVPTICFSNYMRKDIPFAISVN